MPAPRKLRGAPQTGPCGMCSVVRPLVAYRVIRKRLWFCQSCYEHETDQWMREVQMAGFAIELGRQDANDPTLFNDDVDNKAVDKRVH